MRCGWVVLNIEVCDTSRRRALANGTGCVVVAVNYQKAPEHPFPIRLRGLLGGDRPGCSSTPATLNVDAARIGVAGDSAGGNLAAVMCLRAREEGGPPIAFQALIYPAGEHGWDTASAHENAEGYLLQRESMRWFWNHYVPDKSVVDDWRVSPLRAADHSSLPPALIVTAEYDPLRDDGRAYAAKLRDAGVPVTYSEYDGMIHGFYWMQGVVDVSKRLHEEVASEIRAALQPQAISA